MLPTPVHSSPAACDGAASAYVHIPFCARRCGYCNFTLLAGRNDLIDRYLDAIERELSWLERPQAVNTIYVGGGTPTQLSDAQFARLARLLHEWFPPNENFEFSVEANPEDIVKQQVSLFANLGVNRVSLGVQSFDSGKLKRLERRHRSKDIFRCVDLVRNLIPNFSIDLMFGVPGESLEVWRRDLRLALSTGARHISTYGLTFEKGTHFWTRQRKGELPAIDEFTDRRMYEAAIETLCQSGFEHYEVSNFAWPGFRCRHNEAYWLGQSFYAVGAGAARYVDGRREVNHRSTTTYLKKVLADASPVAESESLSSEDRARERLVFGLRRLEGVHGERFARQTGYEINDLVDEDLPEFIQLGLLRWDGPTLRLTHDGLLVSDSIWPHFLGAGH